MSVPTKAIFKEMTEKLKEELKNKMCGTSSTSVIPEAQLLKAVEYEKKLQAQMHIQAQMQNAYNALNPANALGNYGAGLAGAPLDRGLAAVGLTSAGTVGNTTSSAVWVGNGTGITTITVPASTTVAVPASTGATSAATYYIQDDGSISALNPTTLKKQKLKAGDLVVCKNDHPICVVTEDFDVENDNWPGKTSFWQQDKPSRETSFGDYECAHCRASFMRTAPTVIGYEFITRPNAQEIAA